MMVGNGVTDYHYDVWPAYIQTVYNFNLIPTSLKKEVIGNNCTHSFRHVLEENLTAECNATWQKIRALTDTHLNWYDLLRARAPSSSVKLLGADRYKEVDVNGHKKTYKRGRTMSEYTPWMKSQDNGDIFGDALTDYINSPATRKALNIPDSVQAFEMCQDEDPEKTKFRYYPQPEGSVWIYPILRNRVKILFYSGDTDGALPTVGTKNWIKSLNWARKEETRQWLINNQVAGYVEQFEGLDLVTVHGTGHMAPEWKPLEVTTMITAWIHGEEF